MKIPTDSLGSADPRPIPRLSQSRHGDMACETLYVHKHVQSARLAESEAAARGIEIHQILATYINHLVSARRSTDVEVFDGLMRGAGAEAREVLEKFRDNHAFDPEKILATELHIALDEDFLPIEHLSCDGGMPEYEGTLDLMCLNPSLERVKFALEFVRYGVSRCVEYTRKDMPWLKELAQRERTRQRKLHEFVPMETGS